MPELPIVERIDPDLEVLLDRFFEITRDDLEKMRAALAMQDFDTLVRLGHTAKGSGFGYGFKGMGVIGQAIEAAAQAKDLEDLTEQVDSMAQYLEVVKIEFGTK